MIKKYIQVNGLIATVTALAAAITALAAGITGTYNLVLLAQTQQKKIEIENRSNLSTYSSYGDYLKTYQAGIQESLSTILKENLNGMQCQEIIDQTKSKTGLEIFGDAKYKNYKKVHNFYESLGFSLKSKVIGFDIIFDLFTFPAYWDIDNIKWYSLNNPEIWLKSDFSRQAGIPSP